MYKRLFSLVIALFICINLAYAQGLDWMPDPNLRKAIREEISVPEGVPIAPEDIAKVVRLNAASMDIVDLTGLERFVNLEGLSAPINRARDIRPLANLTKLTFLDLRGNAISDVSPLAGLVRLEVLRLWRNQIVDVSPLAALVNLKELWLNSNQIGDFSPLVRLVNLEKLIINGNLAGDFSEIPTSRLIEFIHDESCNLEGIPVSDRIENRDYPSTFSPWNNIINLPSLSWNERLAYHDLRFAGLRFGVQWRETPEGVKLFGHFESAKKQRDDMLSRNPNMIFLTTLDYYAAHPSEYPEDSPLWLRDESGNKIEDVGWGVFLIDFTQPEVQDYFVGQAIEIAKCGLFDGIFLDWWRDDWRDSSEAHYYAYDVSKAAITMLRRIREGVDEIRDDFLIIVNTNRSKIPHSAPYVNGTFMETIDGYSHKGLAEIENTLLWADQNLREPQINCLEGWGIPTESLDSPRNRQWMRLFTTMSLTHSDGYVLYVAGIMSLIHTHIYEIWEGHSVEHTQGADFQHRHLHEHYWYDFYDAPLGRPVRGKGQVYHDRDDIPIEGLFIREFDNGWAVYNRSGREQQIEFLEAVSGVASGIENQRSHVLPDLDGEIYLRSESGLETPLTADVNGDGIVNILDLVVVANAFGEAEPDLNDNGVVNIQDLVIVANNF